MFSIWASVRNESQLLNVNTAVKGKCPLMVKAIAHVCLYPMWMATKHSHYKLHYYKYPTTLSLHTGICNQHNLICMKMVANIGIVVKLLMGCPYTLVGRSTWYNGDWIVHPTITPKYVNGPPLIWHFRSMIFVFCLVTVWYKKLHRFVLVVIFQLSHFLRFSGFFFFK